MNVYKEESPPSHIKYLTDSPGTRIVLERRMGKPIIASEDYTYIELNMDDKTWRTCFMYEFLYRNTPSLSHIDEVAFPLPDTSDFQAQCSVCGQVYINWSYSSPCCGALTYIRR